MANKATLTAWTAFEKAGLFPVEVWCEGYQPCHPRNNGCHTRLQVRRKNEETGKWEDYSEPMIQHVKNEHGVREYGTGFKVKFRRTEGKPWAGWAQLKDAGLEIQDFRCDHCKAQVAVRPADILWHMNPHAGALRKSVVGQWFWMSLNFDRPAITEEDEFADLG